MASKKQSKSKFTAKQQAILKANPFTLSAEERDVRKLVALEFIVATLVMNHQGDTELMDDLTSAVRNIELGVLEP